MIRPTQIAPFTPADASRAIAGLWTTLQIDNTGKELKIVCSEHLYTRLVPSMPISSISCALGERLPGEILVAFTAAEDTLFVDIPGATLLSDVDFPTYEDEDDDSLNFVVTDDPIDPQATHNFNIPLKAGKHYLLPIRILSNREALVGPATLAAQVPLPPVAAYLQDGGTIEVSKASWVKVDEYGYPLSGKYAWFD